MLYRYLVLFVFFVSPAYSSEAIFAGGCFWCIEKDFEYVEGVTSVESGYIGGTNDSPTYENHGKYGHREAVRIEYDSSVVSYSALLDIFFRTVDPTDSGGQFCDRGHSYTTAIYALDSEQARLAEISRQSAEAALGKPVVTPIESASLFTPSEEYHQDYYKKNPLRYRFYRGTCGRDKAVKELWGDAAYSGVAY